MNANYDQIKGYLLGDLSAEECESIDLRLIEDEDFAVDAMAAEDALIESYVDGELSDSEASKFRTHYLTDESRARKVKELVAIRAATSNIARRPEPASKKNVTPTWSFPALFGGLRPVTAFATIAFVLVAGIAIWFYVLDRGMSPLEREYTAKNQGDMSDLKRFAGFSNIQLTHGTFRSGDRETKLPTASLTDEVFFRLPLNFDPAPWAKFDASLLEQGKEIFKVEGVSPHVDGDGSEVRLLLPKGVIKRGQYQISLQQRGQGLSPVVFSFTAE